MNAKHWMVIFLAALASMSSPAWAQSSNRDTGWEYGADLVYLDSTTVDFRGGSTADIEDDFAVAFVFGYRFNPRLEVSLGSTTSRWITTRRSSQPIRPAWQST